MQIEYYVDLGNLISKNRFHSGYCKKIKLNDTKEIISSEVALNGYFPYKLFDSEDEIRVKRHYEESLRDKVEELISEMDNQVENIIDILHENKNIKNIDLKPYRKGNFTLYITVFNSK